MRFEELSSRLARHARRAGGSGDPDVTGVVQHDGAVTAGSLFCCVRGTHVDGHDRAADALGAGAVALLVDHELDLDAPQLLVDDVRAALGPVAATFHDHPSRAMTVVGVTGTNGKTTVTHLLDSIFRADGRQTAVIGTLSPARTSGVPTTPEATELQAELAADRDAGVSAVSMEVSSQALVARRVDATWFAAAVFTNLTQDHLDFHGDVESYFAAKAMLFEPDRCAVGVICRDDDYGRRLLDRGGLPTVAYGIDDATGVEATASGTTFQWRGDALHVSIPGAFNLVNAIGAATTAAELGVSLEAIGSGLSAVPPVRGRFERVSAPGAPVTVIVDYAHTPDALRVAIAAARAIAADGHVVVVFGCGGDKDRAKRPLMGAAVAQLADVAVVTSDNPRSEDPAAIIDEVRAGMVGPARVVVEPDRRSAIALALDESRAGDVVLIAGKGHEQEQIIGDQHLPFDDRDVARSLLEELAAS